jgi:hypothetical protein
MFRIFFGLLLSSAISASDVVKDFIVPSLKSKDFLLLIFETTDRPQRNQYLKMRYGAINNPTTDIVFDWLGAVHDLIDTRPQYKAELKEDIDDNRGDISLIETKEQWESFQKKPSSIAEVFDACFKKLLPLNEFDAKATLRWAEYPENSLSVKPSYLLDLHNLLTEFSPDDQKRIILQTDFIMAEESLGILRGSLINLILQSKPIDDRVLFIDLCGLLKKFKPIFLVHRENLSHVLMDASPECFQPRIAIFDAIFSHFHPHLNLINLQRFGVYVDNAIRFGGHESFRQLLFALLHQLTTLKEHTPSLDYHVQKNIMVIILHQLNYKNFDDTSTYLTESYWRDSTSFYNFFHHMMRLDFPHITLFLNELNHFSDPNKAQLMSVMKEIQNMNEDVLRSIINWTLSLSDHPYIQFPLLEQVFSLLSTRDLKTNPEALLHLSRAYIHTQPWKLLDRMTLENVVEMADTLHAVMGTYLDAPEEKATILENDLSLFARDDINELYDIFFECAKLSEETPTHDLHATYLKIHNIVLHDEDATVERTCDLIKRITGIPAFQRNKYFHLFDFVTIDSVYYANLMEILTLPYDDLLTLHSTEHVVGTVVHTRSVLQAIMGSEDFTAASELEEDASESTEAVSEEDVDDFMADFHDELTTEEAIVKKKERLMAAWDRIKDFPFVKKFISDNSSKERKKFQVASSFVKTHLELKLMRMKKYPLEGEVEFELPHWYWHLKNETDSQAFDYHTAAFRGLLLIRNENDYNDEPIEHHLISELKDYQKYEIGVIPNLRNLFNIAAGILVLDVDRRKDFFYKLFAEFFSNPELWSIFRSKFTPSSFTEKNLCRVLQQKTIGEALFLDTVLDNPLFTSFSKGNLYGDRRFWVYFINQHKKFIDAQLSPLYETLFMIMRAHNEKITDFTEENQPACAEGAYLQILKMIIEYIHFNGYREDIGFDMEIIPCG